MPPELYHIPELLPDPFRMLQIMMLDDRFVPSVNFGVVRQAMDAQLPKQRRILTFWQQRQLEHSRNETNRERRIHFFL